MKQVFYYFYETLNFPGTLTTGIMKKNIAQKLLFACFLFLSLTLPFKNAKASHAMGADITYTCLGNNQYLLTFSFYRDCVGITPSNSMDIEIHNGCGFNDTVVFINQQGPPVDVPTVCPSATTTCHGGTNVGIQQYTYSGIITLPGPCANWTVGHAENARNSAITTITGAGSDNLYVYSMINNTNGFCNNSPTFSNPPVPSACLGQNYCFNHGAFDLEGDSLAYQMITPLTTSNGDTVTYLAGYSATQPVLSAPPVRFTQSNGDICIVPQQQEVTVFAVLVNEYRNGVLIGQVERDIQLNVINCSNIIPNVTGINGTPLSTASICANAPYCFVLGSADPDAVNTTTLTWDASIPGATFTTTGGHRDSATFCWTPTTSDISNVPHCFTVTVKDDNCPYQGQQIKSYCLTVKGVDVDAGPDQSVSCGATVNLVATATLANNATFLWSDGTAGPMRPGVGVGTYVVVASTQAGTLTCSDVDTVLVTPSNGVPVANFYFSNNCNGSPIQFNDSTIVTGSGIVSWTWDFGDGFTGVGATPTHQYGANGTYNVSLIVATSAGCTDTIVKPLTVNTNIPVAQFSTVAVCAGSSMSFNDLSTGSPTVWAWDFGDAASGSNTSNLQSPSHIYSNGGSYTATLTVTNAAGCQNQIQQAVSVNANPTVSVVDPAICAGSNTTLNAPNGFSTYNWDNTTFAQSITVNPAITTNYNITVTDANGCTASDVVTVTVDPIPVANAGVDQTICQGATANLAGAGGANYTWEPGTLNGANVSVSPTSTTDYVVTVTTAAGCSSTDQVRVNVNPIPIVSTSSDMGVCKGESATVSVTNGVGSYSWTPGGFNTSSITVSPLTTTTYTVTVSDAIGCSGTASVTVAVNPIPVAAFSNSGPVCINNTIQFSDLSSITTGAINNWNWDFGNGGTAAAQNTSSLYTSSGNFNVRLIVVSDKGCKDTTVTGVVVNALPIANAGLDQSICPGFNATLTGSGGASYNWNSGAFNTASITVSPVVNTDYQLTVTDANGCTNTDVATVTVNPVPVANAGADQSICFGTSTTIFASGGTNYTWNPGNINTSNYNLTPNATGTYTVTVANQFGCIATDQVTVKVNPIPVATFTSSGAVCQGNTISFTDHSSLAAGTISTWDWNFGNTMTSSNQNPDILFNTPGTYTVNLIVASDEGCRDTITQQQTVWATPVALFTNTSGCLGVPVAFSNASTISDATPLNYSWTLGDGATAVASDPSHTYASEGGYPVSLVVTSQFGCTSTFNGLASVFPLPVADFSVAAICEDDAAQFVNASTVTSGALSTFYWTFGDSGIGSSANPTHQYDLPGDYPITLLISSDHGCLDSTTGSIHVKPKPQIDFQTENVCQGYPVNFTESTVPVLGNISFYEWNFGDGNTTNVQNPTHTYSAAGWYSVSLTASNDSGCSATLLRPNAVNIFASPVADFVSNESSATDYAPLVNFENITAGPGFYYWNFGDGDTSSLYSPTHTYPGVGQYLVHLIAIDMNGCIDSIAKWVEIKPTSEVYIPNAFTPNGDTKNDVFQVYTYNVKDMSVQIYDRWGLKIIEWNDVRGGWDGKVNGNPAQSDTYVYRVSTTDVNEKREIHIGHVSLVR